MSTAIEPEVAPPPAVEEPRPRLWTRKEYHKLGRCGFFRNERVELIEGEIVVMSPMGDPHQIGISLVQTALLAVFETGYTVRIQLPVILGRSEPHPDAAVATGTTRDNHNSPPHVLLVVEVSDTTRTFDLGRKANLYARHGIPEYWVIYIRFNRLVVHRDPLNGAYQSVRELDRAAVAEPLAKPGARIPVADLLP